MREWLKAAREEKGLSREDVAKELRMTRQGYFMVEQGQRQKDMPIRIAMKLSVMLDIPLWKIAEYEGWAPYEHAGTVHQAR